MRHLAVVSLSAFLVSEAAAAPLIRLLPTDPINEGMPSLNVNDLVEDHQGILWAATTAGLVRIGAAGKEVVTDDEEIIGLSLSDQGLCVATAQRILLGRNGELSVLWTNPNPDIPVVSVTSWNDECTIVRSDGLIVLPRKASHKSHSVEMEALVISTNTKDLLVGGEDGLLVLSNDFRQLAHLLEDQPISAVLASPQNKIWVASEKNLFLFEENKIKKTFTWQDPILAGTIREIVESRDGLWLATDTGIGRLRNQDARISLVPSRLINQYVTSIVESQFGDVLYFGLFGGGVNRFPRMRERVGLFVPAPPLTVVASLCIKGNELWAVDSYSLLHFDLSASTVEPYPTIDLGAGVVLDVARSWIPKMVCGDEILLATEKHGLLELKNVPNGLAAKTILNPQTPVWDVISEGDDLWVGTGAGLWKVHGGAAEKILPDEEALSYVTSLSKPENGGLLVGSASAVSYIDIQGKLRALATVGKPVVALVSSGNAVWAGTLGEGIVKISLQDGSVEKISDKQGLTNKFVTALHLDEKSRLWAATDDGLFFQKEKDAPLAHLGAIDGGLSYFQGSNATSGNQWLVGGVGGLNYFIPGSVSPAEYRSKSFVSSVRIAGVIRHRNVFNNFDIGELSANDNEIVFEIDAPAASRDLSYLYRTGRNDEWKPANGRSIALSSLRSDSYQFQLNQGNDTPPLEITFTILRPWWFSNLAITSYATAAALLGFLAFAIFKARVARARKQAQFEHFKSEIALTAAVQGSFFPESKRATGHFGSLAAEYRAATECSGDWWSYDVNCDDSCLVVVGDVTGHGAGPAMVTAAAATVFNITVGVDPAERLALMSKELRRAGRGSYFMTMTALHFTQDKVELFSAGGLPLFAFSKKTKTWTTLNVRGSALGMDSLHIGRQKLDYADWSNFVLLTDGVTEMTTRSGKHFGTRGFMKLLASISTESSIADAVAKGLETVSDGPLEDDWTVLSAAVPRSTTYLA